MRTIQHIWVIVAIVIILCSFPLTGCSNTTNVEQVNDDPLALLKTTTTVSIRLYGLMEFDSFGIRFAFPTSLEVTTVPIGWMNRTFRGFKEVVGVSDKITDQAHGTISSDGKWITSLVFTRKITRSSLDDGIFYQVEFLNVPMKINNDSPIVIKDEGSDLRKQVVDVQYVEQSYQNNQLVITTNYISTDWTKTIAGQSPYILVIFEEGNGEGLPPC